jgi:hypothetical protein
MLLFQLVGCFKCIRGINPRLMQSQVLDVDHWKVDETGGRRSRANQPRVMALQSYGARLADTGKSIQLFTCRSNWDS